LLRQEGRHRDIPNVQAKIDKIYQDLKQKFIDANDDYAIENLAQEYKECLNVK